MELKLCSASLLLVTDPPGVQQVPEEPRTVFEERLFLPFCKICRCEAWDGEERRTLSWGRSLRVTGLDPLCFLSTGHFDVEFMLRELSLQFTRGSSPGGLPDDSHHKGTSSSLVFSSSKVNKKLTINVKMLDNIPDNGSNRIFISSFEYWLIDGTNVWDL